jgi:hypothetical protein
VHHIPTGLYDSYEGPTHEWWIIRLKSDSTFTFENRSLWQLDSSHYDIEYINGRWKLKGRLLSLYQCLDPDSEYTYLENTKWKYRKNKIYSHGKKFEKFYFRKIE